ncbi:hypothetical protein ACFSM7_11380 [Clavibacter michiganensis subsp. tessellarius]|uniref:hypothetical protein n=1 Tax=Clavibacter tessellarius TaxID=31965 RepID=UPI00364290C8
MRRRRCRCVRLVVRVVPHRIADDERMRRTRTGDGAGAGAVGRERSRPQGPSRGRAGRCAMRRDERVPGPIVPSPSTALYRAAPTGAPTGAPREGGEVVASCPDPARRDSNPTLTLG